MKFAMLICGDDREWSTPAAGRGGGPHEADLRVVRAVAADRQDRRRWRRAAAADTARTVRARRRRRPVVTDGPYLELKEVVGGIVILEADTIDEAVEIALDVAAWSAGMTAIEVRPVMVRE